jgi:hypothetical protein
MTDPMTETTGDVRVLIEQIAKWIVDAPDEVFVDHLDDDVIELEVAEGTWAKLSAGKAATSAPCARF